jgi:hypothetical protein
VFVCEENIGGLMKYNPKATTARYHAVIEMNTRPYGDSEWSK